MGDHVFSHSFCRMVTLALSTTMRRGQDQISVECGWEELWHSGSPLCIEILEGLDSRAHSSTMGSPGAQVDGSPPMMSRVLNYSEGLQSAITFAIIDAQILTQVEVTQEHLLLGLLHTAVSFNENPLAVSDTDAEGAHEYVWQFLSGARVGVHHLEADDSGDIHLQYLTSESFEIPSPSDFVRLYTESMARQD